MLRPALALALAAAWPALAAAQDTLTTPQLSPHAVVTRTVGATEISVDYHSPAVRGRKIFGGLVPWGVVWRAGANENTTVSFSHPVTVEGQSLAAGTYGLHMLPEADRFTVIFSNDSTAWGSMRYTEHNDALRVEVEPEQGPHQERLGYRFDEVNEDDAVLALHWDDLVLPLHIGVDNASVVLGPVRERFANHDENARSSYWFQAAEYGRDHGVSAAECLDWIERSVELTPGFSNLWSQSELLAQLGRTQEAGEAREQALELVNVDELASLGNRYMQRDDPASAVAVLEMVVQMDSPSWWPYNILATARRQLGDSEGAAKAWKMALERRPDPVNRGEIEAKLKALDAEGAPDQGSAGD